MEVKNSSNQVTTSSTTFKQTQSVGHHSILVQSALPAIDSRPPQYRNHVTVKLKKQQNEKERREKIENDNYLLLQKLHYIMRTSRVNNTWRTPQPNFLNRIPIFDSILPKIEDIIELDFDYIGDYKLKKRKSKCSACTPQKIEEIKIPEERVPWEPEKICIKSFRSKSVPVRKPEPLPAKEETSHSISKRSSSKKSDRERVKTPQAKMKATGKQFSVGEPHNIVLSRECLKLSVNFPSDTVVKFQEGNVEKFLMRGVCHCKISPTEVF